MIEMPIALNINEIYISKYEPIEAEEHEARMAEV